VFRKSKHQFVFYLFVRIINGNVKICIFVDVRLDVVDTRPGAAHVLISPAVVRSRMMTSRAARRASITNNRWQNNEEEWD
jgi:hypothetical protein